MPPLTSDITGSLEIVPTFLRRVEIADFGDCLKHVGKCSGTDPPEVSLEFREGHFDWVQVGAVWRQEQEPAPSLPHRLSRGGVLVGGEVVENDDGSGGQFWDEHLGDISRESRTVHRALDHPRRNHGIGGEPCDERLRSPRSKRRIHEQPIPTRGPSPEPGQVRLH